MNKREVLEAALDIVTNDRQNDYGKAEDNFRTIAEFWSTYIRARFPEATAAQRIELEPYDVASMMVQMKTSRIVTSPRKEDNWADIIGYGACGAEITDDRDRSPEMPPWVDPASSWQGVVNPAEQARLQEKIEARIGHDGGGS